MRERPRTQWALIAIAVFAGLVVWRVVPAKPAPIRLADGGQLRVLEVLVGTNQVVSLEPDWKRSLRKVLPDSWEGPLGAPQIYKDSSPFASLIVRLEETDHRGKPVTRSRLRLPLMMFGDGFAAAGDVIVGTTGRPLIRFPWYPRDRPRLELQLGHGDEVVRVAIMNPHPTQRQGWQGIDLPQTNSAAGTRIVLRQLGWRASTSAPAGPSSISLALDVQALGEAGLGWTRSRISTIDRMGNRTRLGWSHYPQLRSLPFVDPEIKVVVEIEEYLSAGFVPTEPAESWIPLPVSRRARELGVRFAALVQAGRYRLDCEGRVVKLGAASDHGGLNFGTPESTHWILDLDAGVQGILVITEEIDTGLRCEARLRERIGADDGILYAHHTVLSATKIIGGTRRLAEFHAPIKPRGPAQSPGNRRAGVGSTQTKLEAELIVQHLPVEFALSVHDSAPVVR